MLGAFALVGVILAAVGIYGVVSYTVVQRTGELGIRVALGAQTRDVLWLVLGKGAVLVLSGALLGAAGAYGVSRLLISLIPSLPTRDPLIVADNWSWSDCSGAGGLLHPGASRNESRSVGGAAVGITREQSTSFICLR